ncbi:MAG: acyl-phosphate glycerol 3-phosphate acyltransferase [Verrucomicrobia bacterium RIFCSPHIGHO2_12_FULL_41_10]|nr:MAG: acyl-phosphate glycerol 3-phosphate acyltransferase [Verrucomicrobia bacterium RIFCSPHIGHO2_12_FULL_41_10]HLB32743.1 glycerol-3-phosphate 1-O-acyltransferase PlsY [Chthoniobacterales bacterium]
MINSFIPWIILILGSYLIGSFPAGYLAGCCCGIDIRLHGSGSIGSTNVVRVLNKKWGAGVFAIDFLKGLLPVLLATAWGRSVGINPLSAPGAVAALCSLLGHSFPIWLGFRGGKGIATSAGIIIGMFPGSFLFCIGGWLFFFYLTRYVSIASIIAAILLPLSVAIFYLIGRVTTELPSWVQVDWLSVVVATLMGGLVLWRHRSNMQRLLAGTELRFGEKAGVQIPSCGGRI